MRIQESLEVRDLAGFARGVRAAVRALGAAVALVAAAIAAGPAAHAQNAERRVIVDANAAQLFARLPAGASRPEGITANPQTGEIFAGTAVAGMPNSLFRFDRSGNLVGQLAVGTAPVLGLAFNARDGKIYFAVSGGAVQQVSRIARVPASFGANTAVETVAQVPLVAPLAGSTQPAPTAGTPNGLVFRAGNGDLLFSDSGQSVVFRIADPTSQSNVCADDARCVSMLLRDPLIASSGAPPVGCNGLALSADESVLFIANTGNDQILKFNLAGGGSPTILVQDIDGADGLIRGPGNTLIATANRADQIVVLDASTGRPLAKLGEFLGVRADGTAIGLSTPASVVLVGDSLFVTNLSGASADGMASPEGDVRVATIARIRLPASLRQP